MLGLLGERSLKILVTGGAGFIGSHLAEALLQGGHSVTVLDSLVSGTEQNLYQCRKSTAFKFIKGDCRRPSDAKRAIADQELVYHLAANPEVRLQLSSPRESFENNIQATYVLLESVRQSSVQTVAFASSSTVYGEPHTIPTPEDYGPMKPISVYGASKLACEALISSYCHSFSRRGVILRLANVIGPRATHGVIIDFIRKLRNDPARLEILGDGRQAKSYLYIDDCLDAMIQAVDSSRDVVNTFNIGSEDQATVTEIAQTVNEEMGLHNVRLQFTGGVDGGRGWIGDVRTMLLDVTRIKSLGWKPHYSSLEAVHRTARELIKADTPM